MDLSWHNPSDAEPWRADKDRDALVTEIESLRAAIARIQRLCKHAISEGDYVDYDATLLAHAILREFPDLDQPDASCQVGNASTTSAHES